jgi:hypothetical protein
MRGLAQSFLPGVAQCHYTENWFLEDHYGEILGKNPQSCAQIQLGGELLCGEL